ncbi:Dorsal-ventral patterning tolloid-like protein 1 [Acromyrmex echinatior]|uniref:Dorsal-ventral patterning tolloid-like protein 1 n=1 Tax=Acromyrmex echinatior TaxID=103372 RepID=F4WR87_ACREC|nr:Dorsal-ventral patterning tolloid-like protein 1 [Acromyrmex echinatior]
MSPGYPNPYPSRTHCTYDFQGRGKERVQVIFQDLNLFHSQSNPNDCEGVDSLVAFVNIDGKKDKIDSFCGDIPPRPIMSNGPRLSLEFQGLTSSRHSRGFKATYTFMETHSADALSGHPVTEPTEQMDREVCSRSQENPENQGIQGIYLNVRKSESASRESVYLLAKVNERTEQTEANNLSQISSSRRDVPSPPPPSHHYVFGRCRVNPSTFLVETYRYVDSQSFSHEATRAKGHRPEVSEFGRTFQISSTATMAALAVSERHIPHDVTSERTRLVGRDGDGFTNPSSTKK